MRDLLLIAVVGLCSFVALRRPVFGLLTFVCLGFLNPHSLTWTLGRTFPLSQLIGVGTIAGYLFWSEPKGFLRQREVLLLLALWGMFGVSTLFAIYPDEASRAFSHISKILVMVFLSMSLINTKQRLHTLLRIMSLSLGFHGLKAGIFVIVTGGNYMVFGPEESFLAANNSIGLALVMNLPLLVYLSRIETRSWLQWLMRAMFLFSYPAIICTYSRGAWLGMAGATILMSLKSQHKVRFVAIASVLTFSLLPVVSQLIPQRLVSRYNDLVNYKEESSAQSRFWNWEFCKRVGLAHPLHGGGFDFYSTEAYAIYYPEFIERWGPQKVWSCHSMWFTVLGEHGVLGFLIWVSLMGSYFVSLRRLRSLGKTCTDMAWVADCAHMLQTALVAFMVVGTFLDAAYFDMFYYLVAVLVILKESASRATLAVPSPAAATVKGQLAMSTEQARNW